MVSCPVKEEASGTSEECWLEIGVTMETGMDGRTRRRKDCRTGGEAWWEMARCGGGTRQTSGRCSSLASAILLFCSGTKPESERETNYLSFSYLNIRSSHRSRLFMLQLIFEKKSNSWTFEKHYLKNRWYDEIKAYKYIISKIGAFII